MNGFDKSIKSKIINVRSHILLHNKDYSPILDLKNLLKEIESEPEIIAASPISSNELMIQRHEVVETTICKGIELERYRMIAEILRNPYIGYPSQEDLDKNGIIIGLEMAYQLGATVGDFIQVSSPIGKRPTPMGLLPRLKKLKVVGIFSSDLPDYDRTLSFVSLETADFFKVEKGVDQIEIKTVNPQKASKIAKDLSKKLSNNLIIEDWSQLESNLFSSIKLEKMVMFIILAFMIVITSFNVVGSFSRLVVEKKADLGLLKVFGFENSSIKKIFILAGLIISFLGVIIGLIISFVFLQLQLKYNLIEIPIPGFPMKYLPVEIRWFEFVFVPIATMITVYLATLYPVQKSIQISPIEIIRD